MLPIDDLSDAELVAAVASVVRTPRADPADSFVLHAPLELAARSALLPRVSPDARAAARAEIAAIATTYEAFGPAAPTPPGRTFDSLEQAATRLGDAISAGDLEDVDATASWLGRRATSDQLAPLLADVIVPSLAAAAHGSIFLFQLPRVAPRGELTGELLRPLAREIARNPRWRLRWYEDRVDRRVRDASPESLLDALRATPRLGLPGSDFIYPLMSQAERTGVAAELLARPTLTADREGAARVTLRAAALSMLQEDGTYAPYGWSHCLTMPQAALGVARWCSDPSVALAVAATYLVGFRAALAANPLEPTWAPCDPGMSLATALDVDPGQAGAAVWHSPADQVGSIVTLLATRAAVHHDAHLVKYTLACLDAATWDVDHARLYLSAAAALHGWWTRADASIGTAASASA
jgi:hypothetical protein